MSFIEFEGSKIYYRKSGVGKPVLFGHSYLWDSNMWNEVIINLSSRYCCVSVDLPGHGLSEAMEGVSLKKLSDIHKAVMRHEGFEAFSLVGLSIGAMWGAFLVSDKDIEVEEFIICNSSLTPEPTEKKVLYLGMLSAIEQLQKIPKQIIEQISPGFFSPQKVAAFIAGFSENLEKIPSSNISTIVEVGRSFIERGDLIYELSDFSGRVLVIAGDFDFYRSSEEASIISTAMKCEKKTIPAGHISAVEEPFLLSQYIDSFISLKEQSDIAPSLN